MGRFRKKPVEIEAIQFNGSNHFQCLDFCGGMACAHGIHPTKNVLIISTLEGDMTASPGDWIIRGVKGELYPCKPDIFEATYEAVEMSDEGLPTAQEVRGILR
jgi:hypothetical protein